MKVSPLLAEISGSVLFNEPEATARDVAKTLREYKIGLLFVSGMRGEIVGVISERDIIRGLTEVVADAISAKSAA